MKEIKDYKVVSNKEAEHMFMVNDVLDIYYKKPIKNSKDSVNLTLHFFEIFAKENNLEVGNLYAVPFDEDGVFQGYYCVCDGDTDYSLEFLEYCDNIGLDLDYFMEEEDED